jgi:hypothetical protein
MFLKKIWNTLWVEIFFLVLISGLVYLPRLGELGYHRDDWYFLYAGLVKGASVFIDIALHTRPIRGPLYQIYFSLFGLQSLPYHLLMYITRLAGGLGALWLFHLLWPQKRRSNFFLAALFVAFPGFLWWVSGFEFQPYVLSVTLQVFSIAFTLKAIDSRVIWKQVAWTAGAIFSGWTYLALVEYAIGMEAFRLLCIYLYVKHANPQLDRGQAARKSARAAVIPLVIPVGFFIWYQFFFENWRKAQDAVAQLARIFASPLTGLWWLIQLFKSTLNVALLAWFVPFQQIFYANRLRDILIGLAFAAIVVLVILGVSAVLQRVQSPGGDGEADNPPGSWQMEAIWIGLLGTIVGVLPVVLANRTVTFDRVSQYALPASLAGVILLGGIAYSIFPKKVRLAVLSLLIGLAALTHHGLAAQAVGEQKMIREFWWQMSWRAPSIAPDTLLLVLYPGMNYVEETDIVWGPANFLYYPDEQIASAVVVNLPAASMEQESLINIVMGVREFQRTNLVITNTSETQNYKNLLVLTQPSENSCVHAIDARWPAISIHDPAYLFASFERSKIENIATNADAPAPLAAAFGSEPAHAWCYYYQKADLARQQGDWETIAGLNAGLDELGLHPNDQIEWMPFLQAFAFLGDQKAVKDISTRINTEPYYKMQACRNLTAMPEHGYPLQPAIDALITELFCGG